MTNENVLSALLTARMEEMPIDSPLRSSFERLRADLSATPPHDVFLSVLLRSQGKRIESLRDALLSLAAQTDHDFQVLLLAHDVDDDALAELESLADQYAPLLAHPIRVIRITGGTRATPLNVGFSHATGAYAAVFDDDDVLFAHWVEEFRRAAAANPGRLLRSTTASQRIAPEVWSNDRQGFRSLSWPLAEYEPDFDQLRHLLQNRSPFMSIAFPRLMFHSLGIRADETLDVCEDWDLLLRGAYTLGIAEIPVMTSIYRRWDGGTSSYTAHDGPTWRHSEARVLAKLDAIPLLLAPGQVARIRSLVSDEGAREALDGVLASLSWRLTAPLRVSRLRAGGYRRLLRERLRRRNR